MARDLEALASCTISRSGVADLPSELGALGPRWSVDGPDLKLELRGPMTRTGAVAAFAGALADEMDHHPTIVVEYGGLTLRIHTHDEQAITVIDLVYAARLEQWLRANGWA